MDIDHLLKKALELGASDLHISTGEKPIVRVDGDIRHLDELELSLQDVQDIIYPILNDRQLTMLKDLNEIDFGYSLGELSRFRVNAFHQSRGISAAFRSIPIEIPSLENLDMVEPIFKKLCHRERGLVLVTGPTGSGKSTTLAAMINYLNKESGMRKHIITLEDPIEYMYEGDNCLIQQREVGQHTNSFNQALRAALREDPDILLVGEMRDLETIRLAITAAETGHLVFGTLHTSGASKTIYRIVDAFPHGEKGLIRSMLSESLQAVIAQTLLKKPGGGRHAASEILVCTGAIRNLIREDKIPQIYSSIQTGHEFGMRTFDQHLQELLMSGKIINPDEWVETKSFQAL